MMLVMFCWLAGCKASGLVYAAGFDGAGFDGDAAGFGDAASSQIVKSVERVSHGLV